MTTSGKNTHKEPEIQKIKEAFAFNLKYQKIAADFSPTHVVELLSKRARFARFLCAVGVRDDGLVIAMKQFDGFLSN